MPVVQYLGNNSILVRLLECNKPGFASALDILFPHRIQIYFGSNTTYKIPWIYYRYLSDINCPDINSCKLNIPGLAEEEG